MGTSKAALGRLAVEVRTELELTLDEPFDPHRWASEYGVPFVSIEDLAGVDGERGRFMVDAPELWSAALLRDSLGHVVVYNPVHSPVRVRSNLAHEAAHLIAEHDLTAAWMESGGKCRASSKPDEAEAAELAGALLVPPNKARSFAMRGVDPGIVATKYGVSYEMARWRLDVSGGRQIARRARAKRR